MKLHYFNQRYADLDDSILAEAVEGRKVPETCLLGGTILVTSLLLKRDPCMGCNGPRDRCNGRDQRTYEEMVRGEEQERIRALFTGEDHV